MYSLVYITKSYSSYSKSFSAFILINKRTYTYTSYNSKKGRIQIVHSRLTMLVFYKTHIEDLTKQYSYQGLLNESYPVVFQIKTPPLFTAF